MTGIRADSVYALSSGHGRAGVAVVRVSGPAAGEALRVLCGVLPPPRRASLRRVRHPASGEALDQAIVLWLPGPSSFTGEDMAELHVHGGRAVVAGVLEALGLVEGLRPAEAGEFTRRAWREGRLDLVEAEGLADLIASETAAERRVAHYHMGGEASRVFESWRREVVAILARIEAAIDFSDEEEVEAAALAGLRRRMADLAAVISDELAQRAAERLRDGCRVVIAGPVNAGKSSLFNRMARREAAIVSALPGTTRDVVEVQLDLDGVPLTVADTAGLRPASGDPVEAEGMARSRARMRAADIVLWVTAPDIAVLPPPTEIDSETVWISNKADLFAADRYDPGEPAPALRVSARTGEGFDALLTELSHRARSLADQGCGVLLTRERHRAAVRACRDHLIAAAGRSGPLELVAEDMRAAAEALGRLTGRIEVEALLDEIFASFCIGK